MTTELSPTTQDIYATLEARGFIQDCTDVDGFRKLTAEESISVYCGFDPTADSLHIGSLVPIMGLVHFQRAGHRPVALVGGATGMIGDPSGKNAERNLLDAATIEKNVAGVRATLERYIDPANSKVVNNADWIGPMSFIAFLRDVGKNFRLGEMLGKDSVRKRLESEAGISYTEFSYQLLQAYDFKWLLENEDCQVQCGGGDQWGNITAGIELIRKTGGKSAFGITFPLLLTATGQKLGKTEAGAIWLDPARTSVFDFYQYWVRSDDRDVERFLKLFTFLPLGDIVEIAAEHQRDPGKRTGQKRLALEVTTLIHGEAEARKAAETSDAIYRKGVAEMSEDELRQACANAPTVVLEARKLDGDGMTVIEALVAAGLASSNKDAKRLRAQGGIYLNDEPLAEDKPTLTCADLLAGGAIVLRAGKKRYCLLKFEA
ncbi:MAG: tyrosine--tRNA ligase [Sumerlaeia bacterium]